MKRFAAVLAAAAFLGTVTFAFAAETYTYEAKNGNVTFDHEVHKEAVGGDCTKCHEGGPGPIEVDKDYGHTTCKDCHKEMSGPTKCNACHVK